VAGRDRTGIVIGCVLSVLGVADEQIALDYAASLVMDDDEGRRAHPENMLHLLRMIRERHGSVRGLFADEADDALPFSSLREALVET
jgi:hypothetical protein